MRTSRGTEAQLHGLIGEPGRLPNHCGGWGTTAAPFRLSAAISLEPPSPSPGRTEGAYHLAAPRGGFGIFGSSLPSSFYRLRRRFPCSIAKC